MGQLACVAAIFIENWKDIMFRLFTCKETPVNKEAWMMRQEIKRLKEQRDKLLGGSSEMPFFLRVLAGEYVIPMDSPPVQSREQAERMSEIDSRLRLCEEQYACLIQRHVPAPAAYEQKMQLLGQGM